jgi:cysteine sulfinate desulfinase/cysteine desulfurase-like protein
MIYLDYNATTPLDPEVIAAMRPFLAERFWKPLQYFFDLLLCCQKSIAQQIKTQMAQVCLSLHSLMNQLFHLFYNKITIFHSF